MDGNPLTRNPDMHRARLGVILDSLDSLLREERGEDGTYEVSSIEIDLDEAARVARRARGRRRRRVMNPARLLGSPGPGPDASGYLLSNSAERLT